jgi:HlyD family secretion protein
VSLLPPENIKIRFFVPEPVLANIRVGQQVSIACDACPGDLTGTVSFISPQAEFTPPVIYSRESRAKLVFLVEAKPGKPSVLHPGQPVEASHERH